MANFFDQFDEQPRQPNFFDQFDEPGTAPGPRVSALPPQAAPAPASSTWGDWGRQAFSGVLEGATGALGAPVDIANAAIGLGMDGVNYVLGTDFQPSQEPLGGSAGLRRGLAIEPETDNTSDKIIRRVSQSVGGALVPLSATARTGGQLLAGLGAAAGGGVGGAAAQQMFPGNPIAELTGELLGGGAVGGGVLRRAGRNARREAEADVPTTEQLKKQASDKYDEAARDGVTATPDQTSSLADDMRKFATEEGMISPTGRVSTAYPRVNEALRTFDDYAKGPMDVGQMKTVRKMLADAASSPDPAERRMASIMLEKFDNWTTPMAPSLDEARRIYRTAKRSEDLDRMREEATRVSEQPNGPPMGEALRREYAKKDRAMIAGRERGWTPEEQAAIERVSRGTGPSRLLGGIGRFAPTNPVSAISNPGMIGAGIGYMTGSPGAVGAAGAAAGGGALWARSRAGKLAERRARDVEMMVRNSGPLSTRGQDELRRRITEALIGAQTAGIDR